jgi:hypothetical protein
MKLIKIMAVFSIFFDTNAKASEKDYCTHLNNHRTEMIFIQKDGNLISSSIMPHDSARVAELQEETNKKSLWTMYDFLCRENYKITNCYHIAYLSRLYLTALDKEITSALEESGKELNSTIIQSKNAITARVQSLENTIYQESACR